MESFVTVPELFEEVLDQLPFLDLVIATGVNTTFRNFIASSQRLQRKLFLLPNKPCGSKEHRRRFDKKGIFGAYMSDTCLDASANLDSPPVTLCPFLLEPSHSPRTAHLSIRAAEARFWPFMYLTQPPCAHAHVHFAYGGINQHGMYVLVEAGRTIYRRGGVTLAAIEQALSQSGSVQVSRGRLNMSSTRGRIKVEAIEEPPLYNTTVVEQVKRCSKRYKCKLSMVLETTTIKLHGDLVASERATCPMVSVGGFYALYGMNARKIRFED